MVVSSESPALGRSCRGPRIAPLELVANRPIIHHAMDSVLEAGNRGIVLVGEADALTAVRSSIGEYERWFKQVDYVVCRPEAGISGVLRAAAPVVGDSSCLLQPADGLLDEPVELMLDLLDSSDLVLLVDASHGSEGASGYGAGSEDMPGFSSDHAMLTQAVTGIVEVGLFAPGTFALTAAAVAAAGAVDLAGAGRQIEHDGALVCWREASSWHRYRIHGAELLDLNRVALDRLMGAVPERFTRSNLIEGKVQIDPTASISASTIAGPAVIGPNAVVADSYVGPYTSIGPGARIVGSEVERSIVSAGASLLHVGSRMVASFVGRDTRVFTDFSLPRGLRLWVGDGEELAIC